MKADCISSREDQKRVLAVVRHPVGGVRTHIVYTYPFLMEAGYRFTFVIPDHEDHASFEDDVASWEGTEVFRVPHRDQHRFKPIFRPTVRRLLRKKRFCLLHSHGVQAAIPSMLANAGIGLPHIMTSQDVFHRVKLSGLAGRLKLFGLGQILRRLDALIAVSEDTRADHLQHLPSLKKGPCRVEMIHNGIPVSRFCGSNDQHPESLRDPASLRQQAQIGDDVCLMGFLGRFMEQKGFLVLVEALSLLIQRKEVPPFHLVAIGSGDFLLNYQAMLETRPEVAACITFLEHTPNVAPILRELDLLVMPSLWEAHPLLPMEAMLVGVPIVGTSCLGLREVLHSTPSKAVSPGSAEELADALQEAISNPWKDAARAYIPTAEKRFDVRQTGKELRDLFDDLTGPHGSLA